MPDASLLPDLERLLAAGGDREALSAVLDRALAHFGCVTGTIHRLNPATRLLELVVQRGIPDAILDRVRSIPIGKGMAGIAAERRACVQVCNLQTDDSGVAKIGARLTEMQGSIAAPILVDGDLRGAIGVAKPTPHEFDAAEQATLLEIGRLVGIAMTSASKNAP